MAEILVVADSAFYRRLVPAILGAGHEVLDTAASGVEAVDRDAALGPDVVVMGWDLPIRDGVAAAEEITSRETPASVILFGDVQGPERRQAAAAAGVSEDLVTPFRRRGLRAAIDAVVDAA
jgi:AmiR/NasT family two-component response regulator